jgi:2,3-bisphosphoglycerate-independent phosphoglycerate mutase
MKSVVVVGDGMADEPVAELGGKTPLEASHTPHLDHMAARGVLGLTRLLPASALPAGDIACLAVLGYDPARHQSGCAAFEAAGLGVSLGPGDVAFRLDLVTRARGDDGVDILADAMGGRPSWDEGRRLVADLALALEGDGVTVHAGRGHRHLLVWRGGEGGARTLPPHAVVDQPVEPVLPAGAGSERLRALMDRGAVVLDAHPVCEARRARGEGAPNAIWLWGQGGPGVLPALRERFAVEGAVVAARAVARGIGARAGLRVIDVPGATGGSDTDLRGKVEHGLRALDEVDFLFLHMAAPDDSGHAGDAPQKVRDIERLDAELLGPLLDGLRARGGDWRVMVLADHATPCGKRTHTADPVPFVVYVADHDRRAGAQKRAYHERDAGEQGIFVLEGYTLVERLLRA